MENYHLIVLLCILLSCQDQQYRLEREEKHVLNDVFLEVVGDFAKVLSNPPSPALMIQIPDDTIKVDSKYPDKEINARQSNWDTNAEFSDTISIIEVFDTLNVPEIDINVILSLRDESEWTELIIGLTDSVSSKYFPVKHLRNTGNYKVQGIKNTDKKSWISKGKLIVQFSRIYFNEELTKGCFVVSFYDRLGELVFVEKINEKWEVADNKVLWIS
jgi:hypothetical protein